MKKENVKNIVIPNLIWNLQRLPLSFLNNLRGRSRIKYGMTSLFNNGGFTLIELLVVVLIIGILAAVAVPQYQKAVEKSKTAQAITLLKSIAEATKIYEEQTGQWPSSFDALDVLIPAEFKPVGASRVQGYNSKDTRSNGIWEIQLEKYSKHKKIFIFRTDGRYEGAGFMYAHDGLSHATLNKKIHCFESWPKNQRPDDYGKYCRKLLGGGKRNAIGSSWDVFPYN